MKFSSFPLSSHSPNLPPTLERIGTVSFSSIEFRLHGTSLAWFLNKFQSGELREDSRRETVVTDGPLAFLTSPPETVA